MMDEAVTDFSLHYGDVIKIVASQNADIDGMIYYIDFIDQERIRCISQESSPTTIHEFRRDKDTGEITDHSIEAIEILYANTDGFAVTNGLLPEQWISITFDFDQDTKLTFLGQIKSLEEDQIEIELERMESSIYVDFKYQGLPLSPKIHIELRDLPDDNIMPLQEGEGKNVESNDEDKNETEDEDESNDNNEYESSLQHGRVIFFGNTKISQTVLLRDEERIFTLQEQLEYLLNAFRNKITNPTLRQNSEIHARVERYKQLYLNFTTSENGVYKYHRSPEKPLVEYLKSFQNGPLAWIIPVVVCRRELISDETGEGDDAVWLENADHMQQIESIQTTYKKGTVDFHEMMTSLSLQLIPYDTTNTWDSGAPTLLQNSLSVKSCMDTVIDNNIDNTSFMSSAIDNHKPLPFVGQRICDNEVVPLKAVIMLFPQAALELSTIRLPNTTMFDKVGIHSTMIPQFVLLDAYKKKIETVNELPALASAVSEGNCPLHFTKETDIPFSEYLNKMVPDMNRTIDLVFGDFLSEHCEKRALRGNPEQIALSFHRLIKYMEPFLIYHDTINYKIAYRRLNSLLESSIKRYHMHTMKQKELFRTRGLELTNKSQKTHIDISGRDMFYYAFENNDELNSDMLVTELLGNIIAEERIGLLAARLQYNLLYLKVDPKMVEAVIDAKVDPESPQLQDKGQHKLLAKNYNSLMDLDNDNNVECFWDTKPTQLVKDNEFAKVNDIYYIRQNNAWIEDSDVRMEQFIPLQKLYDEGVKLHGRQRKVQAEFQNEYIKEFKTRLQAEDVERQLRSLHDVENQIHQSRMRTSHTNHGLTQYDLQAYNIGRLDAIIHDEDIKIQSPYIDIWYAVMELHDDVQRFHHIKRFALNYTRTAHITPIMYHGGVNIEGVAELDPSGTRDVIQWRYCKVTGRPLVPTFLYDLACEERVEKRQAMIMEMIPSCQYDSDQYAYVEPITQYVVMKLPNVQGIEFDDNERPIITNSIMQREDGIDDEKNQEDDTKLTQIMSYMSHLSFPVVLKVMHDLCDYLVMNIKDVIDFTTRHTLEIANKIDTEEKFVKLALVFQENRNKKKFTGKEAEQVKKQLISKYKPWKTSKIIYYEAAAFLICMQTSEKNIRRSKKKVCDKLPITFAGYPLTQDRKDMMGIESIICILNDIKGSAGKSRDPWNIIPTSSVFTKEELLKRVDELYEKEEVKQLYMTKRMSMSSTSSSNAVVPVFRHEAHVWRSFLPPIQSFVATNPTGVGSEFQKEFIHLMNTGNRLQEHHIHIYKKKLVGLSMSIISEIHAFVQKKDSLLQSSRPFLQNACCNEKREARPNAFQYFAQQDESKLMQFVKLSVIYEKALLYAKNRSYAHFVFSTTKLIRHTQLPIANTRSSQLLAAIKYCKLDQIGAPIPQIFQHVIRVKPIELTKPNVSYERQIEIMKDIISPKQFEELYVARATVLPSQYIADDGENSTQRWERFLKQQTEMYSKYHEENEEDDEDEGEGEGDEYIRVMRTYHKVIVSISTSMKDNGISKDRVKLLLVEAITYYLSVISRQWSIVRNQYSRKHETMDIMVNGIASWNLWNMYGNNSNDMRKFTQFIRQSTFDMCNVYPEMIKYHVPKDNNTELNKKRWKLADTHYENVRKEIDQKFYDVLKPFVDIDDYERRQEYIDIVDAFGKEPFESDDSDEIEIRPKQALWKTVSMQFMDALPMLEDVELEQMLYKFIFISNVYILLSDNIVSNGVGSDREGIHRDRIRIVYAMLQIIRYSQESMDVSQNMIDKDTRSGKEKEKKRFIKMFENKTKENRLGEGEMKKRKLAEWGSGLRGVFVYNKDAYESEIFKDNDVEPPEEQDDAIDNVVGEGAEPEENGDEDNIGLGNMGTGYDTINQSEFNDDEFFDE